MRDDGAVGRRQVDKECRIPKFIRTKLKVQFSDDDDDVSVK